MKYSFRLNDFQKLILPGKIYEAIENRLNDWQKKNIPERVWKLDPTVWKERKEDNIELSNRLGWLNLPSSMQSEVKQLNDFADKIRKEFDNIVLLGMGGSSLAPEVFYKTFGSKKGYPKLSVLDSTHPSSVKKILDNYDLKKAAFIAASKSGTTTETLSFFYTFFDELSKTSSIPGNHFIAITDSNSALEKLAKEKKFRNIFRTPEEVGGRYSVLTFFGLVPAAIIGVDISLILKRAKEIEKRSKSDTAIDKNPGFVLGAALGEFALEGRDKLTIIASPQISSLPVWIEQLIAESTGKEGKGILPIVGEPIAQPEAYNEDRVFVYLRFNDDDNSGLDSAVKKLEENGFPLIHISLNDKYDLGHEFYRWEIATAMAGAVLKINPFDQPNVQLAKSLAKEYMDKYIETGKLSQEKPAFKEKDILVYGDMSAKKLEKVIPEFLSKAKKGNYAAVMAFVPPSKKIDDALNSLRTSIRNNFKLPVTVGYGPRFLHSTGQLHKGDGNKGYFIQFTSGINEDLEVPDKGYSFGTLISAQAQGDMKALQNTGRKIIRIHFDKDIAEGIALLAGYIKKND